MRGWVQVRVRIFGLRLGVGVRGGSGVGLRVRGRVRGWSRVVLGVG